MTTEQRESLVKAGATIKALLEAEDHSYLPPKPIPPAGYALTGEYRMATVYDIWLAESTGIAWTCWPSSDKVWILRKVPTPAKLRAEYVIDGDINSPRIALSDAYGWYVFRDGGYRDSYWRLEGWHDSGPSYFKTADEAASEYAAWKGR